MANRILRDWTQSENINNLSEKAEVFFTRLIMKADDFGIYHGNVKLLKAALYPLRDFNPEIINDYIDECKNNNLILDYIIENKRFIMIKNFGQRLRQMKKKFPLPNGSDLLTNGSDSPLETKRNETETETESETETENQAFEISPIQKETFLIQYPELKNINFAEILNAFKTHLIQHEKKHEKQSEFIKHFFNWAKTLSAKKDFENLKNKHGIKPNFVKPPNWETFTDQQKRLYKENLKQINK